MESKRLKRLYKEKEENSVPHENFYVQPVDDQMLIWHFTILGVKGTAFEGGVYHGYFKLPSNYPMNPPDIYFRTPNGRFMTQGKICLTITGYHKAQWTPAWSLRTMTQAVANYMLVSDGGIGSIRDPDSQRKKLAKESQNFFCENCGPTSEIRDMIIRNRPKKTEKTVKVAEKKEEDKNEVKGTPKTQGFVAKTLSNLKSKMTANKKVKK